MKLTDKACSNAKPREKAYKLSDGGGLYLEVTPQGSKLWRMKYRLHNKEKRLALGKYPEFSLLEAREGREKARKQLREFKDPSLLKQEHKRLAAESAATTFEAIAREWIEKNKTKWSANHAGTVLRRMELDIFPHIGKLPIKEISTPRLVPVIEDIQKRGAHEMARRSLQYCRAIFSYAKIRGKIEINPADIKAKDILVSQKKGNFAAMESNDLPVFLSKLYRNEGRLFLQTQLAMEFMLLTFVRTNELIKARWEEFDFDKKQWIIPGSRMKMGRDHIVPLSRQSLQILEKLKPVSGHRQWVFPSQRNPRNHMSNNAILVALGRMGYRGIHTGHGFRALAMTTLMEELGYQHEIPDTQLAHAKGDEIRRAYDRTKFLPQRKQMMQDWADYIDKLATNGDVIVGRFSS